jgi:hypothetical protein
MYWFTFIIFHKLEVLKHNFTIKHEQKELCEKCFVSEYFLTCLQMFVNYHLPCCDLPIGFVCMFMVVQYLYMCVCVYIYIYIYV